MKFIEWVTVALLAVETLILLVGVVSRYLLDNPLIWSDELASGLFIWLSMLGAVLAVDRGAHLKLATIVDKLPQPWREQCQTLTWLLLCIVIAALIPPAWQHAVNRTDMTMPSLQVSDGFRAAALPAGCVLMLLAAVARMPAHTTARQFVFSLLTVGVVMTAARLSGPALTGIGNYALILFFAVMAIGVLGGIPIAFVFGSVTLSYLALTTQLPLEIVASRLDEGMSGLVLLSLPLFVLLGALIEVSGLAYKLVELMAALLGHIRGGLQYVLLGAMFLVSGISGSKTADMAAVAPALFPEMERRGAKREELAALLSATGAMTETIPPSLMLITVGAVCGVSIKALFIGGLVPALVSTVLIVAMCFWLARSDIPARSGRAPARQIAGKFLVALPALALPVLIRTAVVEGAATATEVSTIGVAYVLIIGLASQIRRGSVDWRGLYAAFVDAATLSGAILFIIGMATATAWALTQSGFSGQLAAAMHAAVGNRYEFLLLSVVAFVILGSVLEGLPAIVLFGPLLFPVARSMGIHDVHYAMVVIFAMGLGLAAPPFGFGFYAACAIGKAAPDKVFGRAWSYIGVLFVALLAIAFIPWLSTGFL